MFLYQRIWQNENVYISFSFKLIVRVRVEYILNKVCPNKYFILCFVWGFIFNIFYRSKDPGSLEILVLKMKFLRVISCSDMKLTLETHICRNEQKSKLVLKFAIRELFACMITQYSKHLELSRLHGSTAMSIISGRKKLGGFRLFSDRPYLAFSTATHVLFKSFLTVPVPSIWDWDRALHVALV